MPVVRLVAALALLLSGATAMAGPAELQWSELVPEGSAATALPSGVVQHGGLGAGRPLQDRTAWGNAFSEALNDPKSLQPMSSGVRADLDGREIRIAGFITPLGFDGIEVSDFLLAPYVGACIHVPPPPANQIVLVTKVEGFEMKSLYDPVWVTGTLRAVPLSTDVADVGYQIEGASVEPYR